jgi:transposase
MVKWNNLDENIKKQIFDEYVNSNKSYRDLSIEYHVSEKTIYNIKRKYENKNFKQNNTYSEKPKKNIKIETEKYKFPAKKLNKKSKTSDFFQAEKEKAGITETLSTNYLSEAYNKNHLTESENLDKYEKRKKMMDYVQNKL